MLTTYDRQIRFYEGLRNPDWFDSLRDAGVFVIRQRDDGAEPVSWPSLRYLQNVADTIPDKVSCILREVDSLSPFIRRDLVYALLKLPDEHFSAVAAKARWIRHPATGGAVYADLLNVVGRLCELRRADLAQHVSRWILQLRAEKPDEGYELESLNRPMAIADVPGGGFSIALERASNLIYAIDPIGALELVADRLDQALRIEGRDTPEADLSCIWMERLGDTDPAPPQYDAKANLAWRFATIARKCPPALDERVEDLLHRHGGMSSVYRRTHLLRVVDRGDLERARPILLDRDFWQEFSIKVERPRMLSAFYGLLDEKSREQVVELIKESIPRDRFVEHIKTNFGREPSQEEQDQFYARSFVQALEPVADLLTGSHASEYGSSSECLFVASPPPQRPDTATLEIGAPDDILNVADRFLASEEIGGSGSLFHELQVIVQRRPAEFIAMRERLGSLHPENLGAVFYGTRSGMRLGAEVDQKALLDAIEDTLQRAQNSEIIEPRVSKTPFPFHTWPDVLKTCALILNDLVRSPLINYANSERYVRVLRAMCEFPEAGHETQSEEQGPGTSLASIQSMAVLAIVVLAGRMLQAGHSIAGMVQVVDSALAGEKPSTRAAIGESFNTLFGLSADWAKQNVTRIFLSGQAEGDEAAWYAFLTGSQIYARTYEVLAPVYRAHMADLTKPATDQDVRGRMRVMLTHIWVLYANDIERLDDEASLIRVLLRDGADDFISGLLYVAGSDVSHASLPAPMLNRAMELVEHIIGIVEDGKRNASVLVGFGPWTAALALPASWRLSSLERVLRLTAGSIEDEHTVVEALATVAADHPVESIRCTRLLVEAVGSYSQIAVSQFGREAFVAAISAGGDALEDARVANTILVDNGITNFMELFGA